MTRSKFEDASIKAAREFIRTVLIVDDNADSGTYGEPTELVGFGDREERPRLGEKASDEKKQPAGSVDADVDVSPSEDSSHRINAEILQRALLDAQLIGALQIEKIPDTEDAQEERAEQIAKLAKRVDVLVLDWSWGGDNGQYCSKILSAVAALTKRRQLAVIYTANHDEGQFERTLRRVDHPPRCEDARTFEWDTGLRAVVVHKPNTAGNPPSVVDEKDLPEKIFHLFAETSAGLLSNAAMHALSAIRDSTHGILDRFRPEMDAPYLTHRSLSSPASDAEDQIPGLIIDAVSETVFSGVEGHVGLQSIQRWAADRSQDDAAFAEKSQAPFILKGGRGTHRRKMAERCGELAKHPTAEQELRGATLNLEFANLMYCSSPIRQRLTTGVVVAREESESETEYLLCVIPMCDAARICPENGRQFPFLPVTLGHSDKHQFVIPIGETPHECHVSPNLYKLKMYFLGVRSNNPAEEPDESVPGAEGPVLFTDGTVTSSDGSVFKYVAQLRPMVAQAILTSLANNGSRVGTMASEYVRRGPKPSRRSI